MAYTSGDILVRAVMTADSGLPEDTIINDFAFQKGSAATLTDLDDCMTLVSNFYRVAGTSGQAVGEHISAQVDRGATHELQAWFLTGGPPLGSPDATDAWLGPVAPFDATGCPTEVAAVLSFHANLTGVLEESGATRPRARRRGRVYIGPLTITNSILGTAPPYLLDPTLTASLREAAVKLKDDAVNAGTPWAVWSRADATLRPVLAGWTDNAPDTQRRRGPAPTTRVTWGP